MFFVLYFVVVVLSCCWNFSPLPDLSIDNLPAPDLENLSSEDKETGNSRRHQRSLSSEEASEALLDTIAAQQQNARWVDNPNIDTLRGTYLMFCELYS